MTLKIPKGSTIVKTSKPMKVESTKFVVYDLAYPNMVKVEEHKNHLEIANPLHADLIIKCRPKTLFERIFK